MGMITRVDDFYAKGCGRCKRFDTAECSTRQWHQGLLELRRICKSLGLQETVKWGHPCFTYAGRNIALIGSLKNDFRLTFMNASLLNDSEGVLEKAGPNSQDSNLLRFTDIDQVSTREPVIRDYLTQLMKNASEGKRPVRKTVEIELPPELLEALHADAELASAFRQLTPGRQRSYVINLNGAKQSATRVARIARFRENILAGRGAMERPARKRP